jgi:hypothetical protein
VLKLKFSKCSNLTLFIQVPTTTITSTISTTLVASTTSLTINNSSQITSESILSLFFVNLRYYNYFETFFADNASFEFASLNSVQILGLLSANLTQNDCLTNCSQKGECKLINNSSLLCECVQHFSGATCNIDSRPCHSYPCLNNGSCSNLANNSYACRCDQFYTGTNCEIQVDVCLRSNETCSGHGTCVDVNHRASCVCFYMYSGDKCEIESGKVKLVQTVTSLSTIIAIIMILSTYLVMIFMDVTRCVKNENIADKLKSTKKQHKKGSKFKYFN